MSSIVQDPDSGLNWQGNLDREVYELSAKTLADFPNDLARLIFLASIRDYNTGIFLHPKLSSRFPPELVDSSLKLHHSRIFQNLLDAPVQDYVDQLRLYASFAGVSSAELVTTWKDLEAYKSAIPLGYDKLSGEIFALNVLTALSILESSATPLR